MFEYPVLAATSFGLGALHALEPGHGKTVVGAYLVGSRGTAWDAVLLGIVVTLTHTGGVIALGVGSTIAAAYFVPETVQKMLAVVSGLLIVGVGGWMISVRFRQARSGQGHSHHPHHSHSHGSEDDDGDHADERHLHDHGYNHAPLHAQGDDHGHEHAHVAVLSAQPDAPASERRATFWQLVALGVSGGIVPCPAALTVLLVAISVGGFLRGVSLVLIFSVGMACVLVAIGLMMVKAAGVISRRAADSSFTRIMPVLSAIIVTLLGVALTVKAFADLR